VTSQPHHLEDAAQIRLLEARLRLLSEATRAFAEATFDLPRLLGTVATRVAEVLGDSCAVLLLSDDRQTLVRSALHHTDPESLRLAIEADEDEAVTVAGHPVIQRALAEGSVLMPRVDIEGLRPPATTPRYFEFVRRIGLKSILIVALRLRGQSIGLLVMMRYRPESMPFGEHDLDLARCLADHAGLAIMNARHHAAELSARAAAEAAREELRQAQKMEAVGRLAGGIAHDFNNLLSVVLTYTDLILADLGPEESMRRDIEEIHRAGVRASDLTRQLLAFSRQQVTAPRVVDLNEILLNMTRMLRRILGDDVEFSSQPGPRLGRVRVDPGQLEQVVMNLVVNARDAMPHGGRLSIETANVTLDGQGRRRVAADGDLVMLSVRDTGLGMDAATRARIFEPFFTTKEVGKGTGLGLSTVHGIVQQNGGQILVDSEPGRGTVFRVYLPRVDAPAELERPQPSGALRGHETVLVVEDDDQVRSLIRSILLKQGYQVIEANGGDEALARSGRFSGEIHLLLTDVVMPKMSGLELARRLVEGRPGLRVLFMSGYTDDHAAHRGVAEAGQAYLGKPITPELLARKLREVLDGAVASSGATGGGPAAS